MDADPSVLVIGASGIDTKGRPYESLQMNTVNRGVIKNSVGGVARNIAENLARLEVVTTLLSAVGQDSAGAVVMKRTTEAGVDTSQVLHVETGHTGSYTAILDDEGQLVVAISDYDIVKAISPAYLRRQSALFAEADMLAIDASLSPKALSTIFKIAKRYDLPVCADPTSVELAVKFVDYLPDLYMIAPDANEAAMLCGMDNPPTTSETAIEVAQCLVNRGVGIAIVTLAEQGLAYANGSSAGHMAALRTPVIDKTGAGDALTAAVIFGLLHHMPLDEAMRLGVSAAALTLRTRETVATDLSLDRLYDELVV
ncbi:MAG: carbohydrate kinase family protein [Anaerolineae bacterium]|nr:carbohydrate kinase family protein [Anaerolineae bacterium]